MSVNGSQEERRNSFVIVENELDERASHTNGDFNESDGVTPPQSVNFFHDQAQKMAQWAHGNFIRKVAVMLPICLAKLAQTVSSLAINIFTIIVFMPVGVALKVIVPICELFYCLGYDIYSTIVAPIFQQSYFNLAE